MQCPCGGMTLERIATWRGTDLTYQRCPACGRCGSWLLVRAGEVTATGREAQARFEAERRKAA